jgi:hypothetical protein
VLLFRGGVQYECPLLSSEDLLVRDVLLPVENLIDELRVVVEQGEALIGLLQDLLDVLVNLIPKQ